MPSAWAQEEARSGIGTRPTIGLALSGGAAKGFAHIGVLQVLDEAGIPIDVVAGTSMGALLGGLYAAGYDGHAIERLVTEIDIMGLLLGSSEPGGLSLHEAVTPGPTLLDVPMRGLSVALPDGLLTGQRLIETLARLMWDVQAVSDFRDLPRPFACNAIDLVTGDAVVLDAGYLPMALRTCMSLPSVFRPIHDGDAILVDGGPDHMLPVSEARHLGADLVIGVDVSGDVDPATQEVRLTPTGNDVDLLVLFQKASTTVRRARALQDRQAVDVLIEPDVTTLPSNDLRSAAVWIPEGRRAATAALPALRALVASYEGAPNERTPADAVPPPALAPVRIDAVYIEGVEGAARRLAERMVRFDLPATVTPERVARLVAHLMATGSYEYVIPRLVSGSTASDSTAPGATAETRALHLSLVPKEPADHLGLGLRYDDLNGGELLAALTLRHRLRYGDRTTFALRLGEQSELHAVYTVPLGLTSPVEVGGRLALTDAPFETQLLSEAKRRSTVRQTVGAAALLAGWTPHPDLLLGAALEAGFGETTVEVFPVDSNSVFPGPDGQPLVLDIEDVELGEDFYAGSLFAEVRTLDRRNVPTRGVLLRAAAEVGRGIVDLSEVGRRVTEQLGLPADSLGLELASGSFSRVLVDGRACLPLSRRLSVCGRAAYAHGSGEGLPTNRETYLGGIQTPTVLPGAFFPLYGHVPQAETGTDAWLGVLSVQRQVGANTFVRLLANVGRAYGHADRTEDDGEVLGGVGLDLDYRTPIGPLTLSLGTDRLDRWPDFSLRIGYRY